MTHTKLSKVRRLAVALVLGNLALIALLGVVLPQPALALLPIFALMLPLLSAAAIEGALRSEPTKPKHNVTRLCSAPRFTHALHHAA
jgi:hypothetical protein